MHLPSPSLLQKQFPLQTHHRVKIDSFRKTAQAILNRQDKRMALIIGPCSIHDYDSAIQYAYRLAELQKKVEKRCFLIMRVYIEKPRTTIGWKGFLLDPDLNGTSDVIKGLEKTRQLMLAITELGLPIATEFLESSLAPYHSEFITWGFIGARTSSSQPHRELAASLSFPIGFKNRVEGDILTAIQGAFAASKPQNYININSDGKLSRLQALGNPYTHLVLRGSNAGMNCDPVSLHRSCHWLNRYDMQSSLMVDCAHGNSQKDPAEQFETFCNLLKHSPKDREMICAYMLESYLKGGSQPHTPNDKICPDQSLTDPCLSWDETEELIALAAQQ